jgi:glyoxylase-like metal-dependent hydrolase (beta-lactamase superfamily II)
MTLRFLGTRGEIDARTRRHRMHTALLVSYRGANVMIDAGLDWLGKLKRVDPNAIALTHAHPDHAWGLKQGAVSGVCAAKDVAGIATLPDQRSPPDRGAYAHEDLWNFVRGISR